MFADRPFSGQEDRFRFTAEAFDRVIRIDPVCYLSIDAYFRFLTMGLCVCGQRASFRGSTSRPAQASMRGGNLEHRRLTGRLVRRKPAVSGWTEQPPVGSLIRVRGRSAS